MPGAYHKGCFVMESAHFRAFDEPAESFHRYMKDVAQTHPLSNQEETALAIRIKQGT